MTGSKTSSNLRLLCEGWLEPGNAPAAGSVMYPTLGYVEQAGKVWVAFGDRKLDESSDQTIVENYEDLELEERTVGEQTLKLPKNGRWVVEGPFQRSDVPNANKRKYPRSIWEKLIADEGSYVQKAIKERAMLGHLEHPADGRTDGSKGAIVITKAVLEKDGTVTGQAELLDTPMGLILQEYTRKRVRWGVSSRGNGSVSDEGVVSESNFVLETWDAVMKPSVQGCFPTPIDAKSLNNSTESEAELEEARRSYADQVDDARRKNAMPPKESNWYAWAKKHDQGVLDLDAFAQHAGFDDFDDMDISISPRSFKSSAKYKKAMKAVGLDESLDTDLDEAYYRMQKKVIGNDLFVFQREMVQIYETAKRGSDFPMERWKDAKKMIPKIERGIQKNPKGGMADESVEEDLMEGVWEVPDTVAKAKKLQALFRRPIPAEKAGDVLFNLIGDDDFHDQLADYDNKDQDVRNAAADHLLGWLRPDEQARMRNPWKPGAIKIIKKLVLKHGDFLTAADKKMLKEGEEQPEDTDVFDGLIGEAKEYAAQVCSLVETDQEALDESAMKDLHQEILTAMGRGNALEGDGLLNDEQRTTLQGWLTKKLAETDGPDVDADDALEDALRLAQDDVEDERRSGFDRVTESLRNRLGDALAETGEMRERLEVAESRCSGAEGQNTVVIEQLSIAEGERDSLSRRLELAEDLLATRPVASVNGAVAGTVDEVIAEVSALEDYRTLLERAVTPEEVRTFAESLIPRAVVVPVQDVPEGPRPSSGESLVERSTLPVGNVCSSDDAGNPEPEQELQESAPLSRDATLAGAALRRMGGAAKPTTSK